jgi:beta-lactamase superfamily II metal-dependent hydrolase
MSSQVEMVFWDVQHGHSTYIKSPNNRHIVIDLGIGDYSGNDSVFSPLKYLKYNYHVNQLDLVIVTHPHLDHIDDISNFELLNPKVFRRPKQITNREVMEGVRPQDKVKYEKYCEINDRYSIPVGGGTNDPDNPDNPENFGDMKIMSFTPSTCLHDNFNNHSIVTVVEFADIKVVIPGDNQKSSYDELMLQDSFKTAIKDADILLAPHHGRESGYDNDFVSLVNPRLTIVSDGRFCDTSANGRYSQKSRGWLVHKGNGTSTQRKCLTTNSDGEVFLKFGYDSKNTRFLSVNIS